MPQRKPGVGPYELFCPICWRIGVLVTFTTAEALNSHLRNEFIEAAPAKIIAVA